MGVAGILHAGRDGERTGKTGKADFEGLIYADWGFGAYQMFPSFPSAAKQGKFSGHRQTSHSVNPSSFSGYCSIQIKSSENRSLQ